MGGNKKRRGGINPSRAISRNPSIPGFTLLNGTANLKEGRERRFKTIPLAPLQTIPMIFTAASLFRSILLARLYGACRANEMKFMQIAAQPTGPPALLYRGGDASNLYHEGETVLPPSAAASVARLKRGLDHIFSRSHSESESISSPAFVNI